MDSFQRRIISEYDYDNKMQNKLDSTMPWIGMYIVAASAVCSLAMATDAFHGFHSTMLWFPCKYFSFNAMSLTLLAVTLKIPVDLTANMLGIHESLARVSSLVLMSTAMANFMTSLGSMDNNEMLLNLAALGIMIITVIGNICIHYFQLSFYFTDELLATIFLFLCLVILCYSTLTVVTTRSYIECKYHEMRKIVLDEDKVDGPKFPVDKLRLVVKKYWVMAVIGCSQFVMVCSVTCTAIGLMCVSIALNLAAVDFWVAIGQPEDKTFSAYNWSITWILHVQSIGVALGTIAPVFRWFTAAQYKCSELSRKSFKNELKIETYWIQRLVDWRESSLPLQIQHRKWKKFLHAVRRLVLNCCIGVQILLVWASKIVLHISASLFHHIKKLKIFVIGASNNNGGLESGGDAKLDITRYVI